MNKKYKGYSQDLVIFLILSYIIINIYNGIQQIDYNWEWKETLNYLYYFDSDLNEYKSGIIIEGVLTTIRISIFASFFAFFIGLFAAIFLTTDNIFIKSTTKAFVDFIRGIPQIVFLFIFYFFISSQIMPFLKIESISNYFDTNSNFLFNFTFGNPKLFENFIAGVISLAIFEAVYIAEIIKGGIKSINKEQYEAGFSIGLSKYLVLKLIILPQALKKTLPSLTGQFISLIKDTSILSIISIQELTYIALETSISTKNTFEIWLIVAIFYFFICFSLSMFSRIYFKKEKN